MLSQRSILFYGDPHGEWRPLLAAVQENRPAAVVLLGDCDLDMPLRQKLAPVWELVPCWRWICGNHDADTEAQFDHLFTDYPAGNLHAVLAGLAGHTVAGLGGIYKEKVWHPGKFNAPVFRTRDDMIRRTARFDRWRGGVPRKHRDTIFYEDHETLGQLRADILVTHEAPGCHPNGFVAIDELAQQMGVRLVVHGHHHVSYEGRTADGIPVRGLAQAEPWLLDPAKWWT